jgi:hypothetical protein
MREGMFNMSLATLSGAAPAAERNPFINPDVPLVRTAQGGSVSGGSSIGFRTGESWEERDVAYRCIDTCRPPTLSIPPMRLFGSSESIVRHSFRGFPPH